jgi:hypothetical protein
MLAEEPRLPPQPLLIQTELPLREVIGRERTIGEVLELLVDATVRTEKAG